MAHLLYNNNNIIYIIKQIRAPFDTPVPVSLWFRIFVIIIIHGIILYKSDVCKIPSTASIYIYIYNLTNPFYEYIIKNVYYRLVFENRDTFRLWSVQIVKYCTSTQFLDKPVPIYYYGNSIISYRNTQYILWYEIPS